MKHAFVPSICNRSYKKKNNNSRLISFIDSEFSKHDNEWRSTTVFNCRSPDLVKRKGCHYKDKLCVLLTAKFIPGLLVKRGEGKYPRSTVKDCMFLVKLSPVLRLTTKKRIEIRIAVDLKVSANFHISPPNKVV